MASSSASSLHSLRQIPIYSESRQHSRDCIEQLNRIIFGSYSKTVLCEGMLTRVGVLVCQRRGWIQTSASMGPQDKYSFCLARFSVPRRRQPTLHAKGRRHRILQFLSCCSRPAFHTSVCSEFTDHLLISKSDSSAPPRRSSCLQIKSKGF
jgi:hypothetical protein